ncbi:hypothetical protein TNCV_5015021 [Trichonephila clavipes]|nr:hypothetical protein TNCV_5015021 [Trichonephila clavipes]
MHLIYGLAGENPRAAERLYHPQRGAPDHLIFANLPLSLCEYQYEVKVDGPRYRTHFASCIEQNVLDTVRRNPSTMLGARVIRGPPSF